MADDIGNFHPSATLAAPVRKSRSNTSKAEIVPDDCFVSYGYIEATFGHGFGRTNIWRKVREGRFPKPTLIGNQNKWRKSVIDAKRDELIPPASNT
jgi:predicted DNA-binding transcriptional regulator AlpA